MAIFRAASPTGATGQSYTDILKESLSPDVFISSGMQRNRSIYIYICQAFLQSSFDLSPTYLSVSRNAPVSEECSIAIWLSTECTHINNKHERIRAYIDHQLFESPGLYSSGILTSTPALLPNELPLPPQPFSTADHPSVSTYPTPPWSQVLLKLQTKSPSDIRYTKPTHPPSHLAQQSPNILLEPTLLHNPIFKQNITPTIGSFHRTTTFNPDFRTSQLNYARNFPDIRKMSQHRDDKFSGSFGKEWPLNVQQYKDICTNYEIDAK